MLDVPNRKFGVADRASVAELTGRAFLEGVMRGELPAPPMAKTLNFTLVEVGDGSVVFEGEPSEAFLNPMGAIHGGFALTLIDSAAGCAGMSLLPPGAAYATIETKANFSRPITIATGRVRADAKVVARGRRIMSAEARITDAQGRVLAHGTSTLMVVTEG